MKTTKIKETKTIKANEVNKITKIEINKIKAKTTRLKKTLIRKFEF